MMVKTFILRKTFCPIMSKSLRDHELAMNKYPGGYLSAWV